MERERGVEELGSYLRQLRRRKRLSLQQVQEETGASGSYLSQVEQGKRHPSGHLLRKIAPTYGASVRDLLTMAGHLDEPEVTMSDQERIEILDGVKPDDTVIVGPFRVLDELEEGQPVELEEPEPTEKTAPSAQESGNRPGASR